MRKIISLLVFIVVSFNLMSANKLSGKAEISLITCSPGNQLYSLFGHSALRVADPVAGFDLVFNYGMFDFDTPNFYLKFSNGNLNYWLTYYRYSQFKRSYAYHKQSVTEHGLNLNQEEKQKLFDALLLNAQDENKFYRYDFFFDNCATRIREIVIDNLQGEVVFAADDEDMTFRNLIHEYQVGLPWIQNGLDILLGIQTDDKASQYDQMLMPKYLLEHFKNAQIKLVDGTTKPLLTSGKSILEFEKEERTADSTPTILFWILLIGFLVLAVYEIKKRKKPIVVINRILFLITGLVGCLVFFLWFLSRHTVTADNLNILWALPFNVFIAFLPAWFYRSKAFMMYLVFASLSLVIMIFSMVFNVQGLPSITLPLALILLSRYIPWIYQLKNFKG